MLVIDPYASDPFRVVNGNSPIANDLDPNVLFSAKYRGGIVTDEHVLSPVPNSGWKTWNRYYDNYPTVLAVGVDSGGGIIYPQSTMSAFSAKNDGMDKWYATRYYLQIRVFREKFEYEWADLNIYKLIVYAFG